MSFPIEKKLVISVASSAVFNLTEADKVFREQGEEAYRKYTLENEEAPFEKGSGFSFLQRILAINDAKTDFEPIEVVLLSKNDADTGNRVFNSFKHYGMSVIRAAFTNGASPYTYMDSFNSCLFLSANKEDVEGAVSQNFPGGLILPSLSGGEEQTDVSEPLKIAFDFDGILADDSAEKVFKEQGLKEFYSHEEKLSKIPLPPGPLLTLLKKISDIQKLEFDRQKTDVHYKPRIQTALITARSAPAHERVVHTIRHWGIHIDSSFFLGGISKSRILDQYRPHIFFDDQIQNLENVSVPMAMVHVPYGVVGQ